MTEAKKDFETCIELNDKFIPAKTQLAYCIYKSAVMQQAPILVQGAVQMLENLVEKFPDSPDAIGLYAQVSKFDLLRRNELLTTVYYSSCTVSPCKWVYVGGGGGGGGLGAVVPHFHLTYINSLLTLLF